MTLRINILKTCVTKRLEEEEEEELQPPFWGAGVNKVLFVGYPRPYPRVSALDIILLHPFQGVDTILDQCMSLTGQPGSLCSQLWVEGRVIGCLFSSRLLCIKIE